jgi:hypothetical protein
MGSDGEFVFEKLNRDLIEDGMEVHIDASRSDKVQRRREAFELARVKMTDPLSFFEDIESNNPKERAERLILFSADLKNYMVKFIMDKKNVGEMAEGLNEEAAGQDADIRATVMSIMAGERPQMPEQLTPQYVKGVQQFIETQKDQMSPQARLTAAEYGGDLMRLIQGGQGAAS